MIFAAVSLLLILLLSVLTVMLQANSLCDATHYSRRTFTVFLFYINKIGILYNFFKEHKFWDFLTFRASLDIVCWKNSILIVVFIIIYIKYRAGRNGRAEVWKFDNQNKIYLYWRKSEEPTFFSKKRLLFMYCFII